MVGLVTSFSGLQPTRDAICLRGHGEQAHTHLYKFTSALAAHLGLDPAIDIIKGPIKDLARIYEKAADKYGGRVDKVCDIARERLLFEDTNVVSNLRSMLGPGKNSDPFLRDWKEKGVEIVEMEDYFAQPKEHGYFSMHLKVSVDLGKGRYHMCEIQVKHRDQLAADELSRTWYQEIRKITDVAASEGRKLNDVEKACIKAMLDANIALYEAEAHRLELVGLRDVRPQAPETKLKLQLVA